MMAGLAPRLSERVYRALLVAYPKGFRDAYGPHMVQVFRDACREAIERTGVIGLVALWASTVIDLLHTAHAERRRSNIASGDRLERMRRAMLWHKRVPSRSGLWALVVMWAVLLVVNIVLLYFDQRRENVLESIGMSATFYVALISISAGKLLYARRRHLAGLLWILSLFVLFPLGIALMVTEFWSRGTPSGVAPTLLYSGLVMIFYGTFAWRYFFSTRSSDARRG